MTAPNTPWTFDPSTGSVDGADGTPVAYVSARCRTEADPDGRDVGCLMAAGPEMLAALKRLLQFNEELCADVGVSKHYPSAENARAVISKAEGRAP